MIKELRSVLTALAVVSSCLAANAITVTLSDGVHTPVSSSSSGSWVGWAGKFGDWSLNLLGMTVQDLSHPAVDLTMRSAYKGQGTSGNTLTITLTDFGFESDVADYASTFSTSLLSKYYAGASDVTISTFRPEPMLSRSQLFAQAQDVNDAPLSLLIQLSAKPNDGTLLKANFTPLRCPPNSRVPDAASTFSLLGLAGAGIGLVRRKFAA